MILVEQFEVVDAGTESSLASSKERPCFFWLARFFARSQVTLTMTV